MSIRPIGAMLSIRGERFSPAEAEAQLGIDFGPRKNEPGELGTKAPFAGMPIPHGAALWMFRWEAGLLPEPFAPFEIPHLRERLIALGAESIDLYIHVEYMDQCNLELPPELLNKLASLGVDVALTCSRYEEVL